MSPGASAAIQATWPTPANAAGAYRVSVYVLYNGRATEPLTAAVHTGKLRFLPLMVH